MQQRRQRYACRVCDRPAALAGPLSARGKCRDCGRALMIDAAEQIREHSGPVFQKWRRNTILAFGGRVPDDSQASSGSTG